MFDYRTVAALVHYSVLLVTVACTTTQAFRSPSWRGYWAVAALMSWGAAAGAIASEQFAATVDADGVLHENFALVALTAIAFVASVLMTMVGMVWQRLSRRRWTPRR